MGKKLATLEPTAEEVAHAREILAKGTKTVRSKVACMASWPKANGENNFDVSDSRSELRRKYLEAFLVMQMREKAAKKSVVARRQVGTTVEGNVDVFWWGTATMDEEVGEDKGEAWRESGQLATRPDPVTGSTEDPFKEYRVEREWTRHGKSQGTSSVVEAAGEPTPADLEQQDGMLDFAMGPETPIKLEPESPEQILEERAQELASNPGPQLRRFQDHLTQSNQIQVKAEAVKYATKLAEDNGKLIQKLKRIIGLLDKMMVQKGEMLAMRAMIQSMDSISHDREEILEWAAKFQLMEKLRKRMASS